MMKKYILVEIIKLRFMIKVENAAIRNLDPK